jgi:hypothetical protein
MKVDRVKSDTNYIMFFITLSIISYITGIKTAGNRLPHLIFFPNTILIPIPNIRIDPTKEILATSLSLKYGSINLADNVIPP